MSIVIGIDVGISTTKIVGVRKMQVVAPMRTTAADPVASLYGAFGKYLYENHIELADVEQVVLTGVGAAYIERPVYGLPTCKSDEFVADGLGARFESGLDRIIVVSMGTGTSLVRCDGDDISHIGGISIGGGTLAGLCNAVLGVEDVVKLSEMAKEGSITACDLTIGDISRKAIPGLPMDATASNFGKVADDLSREDKAAGIFNLVYQAIGSMSVLTSKICGLNDIVFTGQLTAIPICKDLMMPFAKLYNANFIVPDNAEFATAVGSCLAGTQGEK